MPTPDRTSLAEIVDAGRAILEESGPAGLTMQAVAIRCGVRAPSLYKRIRDRDALLAAVAEAVVNDLADRLADTENSLSALAETYRAFAHENAEGFRLMFTASAPLDALDHAATPVLAASAAVVGDVDALHAARLFTAWATGFVHMELAGAFRLGGDVEQAFTYGLRKILDGLTP
ncbi:TetR/AcrR family transcriptional regulator [Microbacterium sp.]|uniref:TetR/AcrR family transcriptional regulator n=1 Tax=Microbacterium sp. TaxID=51671 RepID=UPI00262B624C|nr:TetR/AcrR family transcriptional regulator [Microbacterium sp.]